VKRERNKAVPQTECRTCRYDGSRRSVVCQVISPPHSRLLERRGLNQDRSSRMRATPATSKTCVTASVATVQAVSRLATGCSPRYFRAKGGVLGADLLRDPGQLPGVQVHHDPQTAATPERRRTGLKQVTTDLATSPSTATEASDPTDCSRIDLVGSIPKGHSERWSFWEEKCWVLRLPEAYPTLAVSLTVVPGGAP
jgi:hypothetical protein